MASDRNRRPIILPTSDFGQGNAGEDGGDSVNIVAALSGAGYPFCGAYFGAPVASTLQCRTKGGTATLCGFSEYVNPSVPPIKYLAQFASGAFYGCAQYGTAPPPGCAGGNYFRLNHDYSGAYQFSAVDCSTSDTGLDTQTQTTSFPSPQVGCFPGTCPIPNGTVVLGAVWAPGFADVFTIVTTSNQVTYTAKGCAWFVPGDNDQFNGGTVYKTLSGEDTEQNAIDRLMASTSFGAFGGCSAPGSSWQARVAGFSFAYQRAEWRVTAAGLNPTSTHCFSFDVYRSAYGAGVYTLFETLYFSVDTDAGGNLSATGTVVSDRGFDFYVANQQVYKNSFAG